MINRYYNENKLNHSSYELYDTNKEVFLKKLNVLCELYDIPHAMVEKDDEDIYDNLFIIKINDKMNLDKKIEIWDKISDEMYIFSEKLGIIDFFNKNGIIVM